MRVLAYMQLAAIAVAVLLPLCTIETAAATDDGMTRNCRQHYRLWKKMANQKAFAVSQKKDGLQGCGYTWAWQTREQATSKALKECTADALVLLRGEKPNCRLVK